MNSFLSTKSNTDLARGIIGCIQAAMYVDGDANDVEIRRLSSLLAGRNIFAEVQVMDVFNQTFGIYIGHGADYLLRESCKLISEDWHATVYSMCCEILFSDTIVGVVEKDFLKSLQQHLNLNDDTVNKILDVMLILHKGRLN